MKRPNIIYILADDMGYGDMKCNNPDSKIPTPNLDKLASEGMRFTDAHASSSVCTPSRYGILTGRYCWRTALKRSVIWSWDLSLIEPDRVTVGKLLQQNGYKTACFGKWHLGLNWETLDGAPPNQGVDCGVLDLEKRYELGKNIDYTKPFRGGPVDCGFDYYFGDDAPNLPPYTYFENDTLSIQPTEESADDIYGHKGFMAPGWNQEEETPEFTRRAVKYIEESGDEPFFLYYALTGPHTPLVPTPEFRGNSDAGDYGDFMCEMDWSVGEIMNALDRKGIADNTLFIFTSDNGPEPQPCRIERGGAYYRIEDYGHYSMAHLRGAKRDTWEGGHRVPFIVRWPEVTPAGTVCDQLVSLADFICTCADILETELPEGAAEDSTTIYSLIKGDTTNAVRDSMVHQSCSGKFAFRKDNWVFINNPTGDDNRNVPDWLNEERGYTKHNFPGELFDVRADISERKNLYGDYPEIVKELSDQLKETINGDCEYQECYQPDNHLSE